MQGEEFSTDWIFLPPLKQTNRHKNENLRPNLHHYHHIIIMITTIIMIDIIWNFSPPLSHPGRGSFPSNSWTMDMALSNYQYTKGKHWYFKNAGKKEMGLSVCLEFSDISSHMMPAKIPIIVLILKRGPCLSCCGGRASVSIQYVQYMLFDGRSHLFLIFLPQMCLWLV